MAWQCWGQFHPETQEGRNSTCLKRLPNARSWEKSSMTRTRSVWFLATCKYRSAYDTLYVAWLCSMSHSFAVACWARPRTAKLRSRGLKHSDLSNSQSSSSIHKMRLHIVIAFRMATSTGRSGPGLSPISWPFRRTSNASTTESHSVFNWPQWKMRAWLRTTFWMKQIASIHYLRVSGEWGGGNPRQPEVAR
jgi:hypothetical protein